MFFVAQAVSAPSETALATVGGLMGFGSAGSAAVAENAAGSALVERVMPHSPTVLSVIQLHASPRLPTFDRGAVRGLLDLPPVLAHIGVPRHTEGTNAGRT